MTIELPRILVTGAAGYIGQLVIERLADQPSEIDSIVAVDVKSVATLQRFDGVHYVFCDVRDPKIVNLIQEHRINTVVHLASIVNPGGPKHRAQEYSVDVLGTKNLLQACIASGVRQIVLTSSGAAYGYHADNPIPLYEFHPLRGNSSFPYSDHKRQVEEMLEEARGTHPELRQLIFRPCTVLGSQTRNSITALFDRPRLIGLRGHEIPFVLVWDQDVVDCIVQGITKRAEGIYNLAGDGVLTLQQMAQIMGKPIVFLPPWLLGMVLRILQLLRLSPFGPEHIDFLRYRPVLANEKLKNEFGYIPQKSTLEVLMHYLDARRDR